MRWLGHDKNELFRKMYVSEVDWQNARGMLLVKWWDSE